MRAAERTLLVGQPVVFAIGVILEWYVAVPTTVEALVRPVLVVVALALATLMLAPVVTRSWALGALLASTLVLFSLRELVLALGMAVATAAWPLLIAVRRVMRRTPPSRGFPRTVARATGIFSAVFLFITSVGAVGAAMGGRPPEMHLPEYVAPGTGGPNIYFLLLDGYPRADTLKETFDFDNEPFVQELQGLGFTVADEARTNYNKTWLTLASALNGAYIEDLLGDQRTPNDAPGELRWLQTLIREASVPNMLRDQGYAIRTVPPPYTSAALTTADEVLDGGHLTELEVKLISASPWTLIFRDQIAPLLYDGQARRVVDALATTVDLAESLPTQPQFVLSHIHSPHSPFVLRPASSPGAPSVPDCFPICSLWEARIESLGMSFDEYRSGLSLQVQALNEMLIGSMRKIIAADPEAVIILMSDHGARYSLEDLPEHYRSFLAARTPGVDSLFPPDESPVNIFRRLMAAYFDVDIEPLPYRSWTLDWAYNLRLTERPAQ
jgi:hypothetical protein